VFYESLGCATPVITTPEVDTWPELESSGGAVIVKRDAQKYADAMSELIKDPERLKSMGAAGRAWLFENLDPIKVVSDFEKLYQGAMGLDGVKPGVPAMASA
jgi:glycosyltransferase involved in cell wall biosynthesis